MWTGLFCCWHDLVCFFLPPFLPFHPFEVKEWKKEGWKKEEECRPFLPFFPFFFFRSFVRSFLPFFLPSFLPFLVLFFLLISSYPSVLSFLSFDLLFFFLSFLSFVLSLSSLHFPSFPSPSFPFTFFSFTPLPFLPSLHSLPVPFLPSLFHLPSFTSFPSFFPSLYTDKESVIPEPRACLLLKLDARMVINIELRAINTDVEVEVNQ